jgi:hypothetical protein
MRRCLPILALLLLAGACTERDPDRLVIGVSYDRAAGSASPQADEDMRRVLDVAARQICTHGYEPAKVSTLAAENNYEIVTEDLRCRDYRVDFTPD